MVRNGSHQPREILTFGWRRRGGRAAGQRPAHRPADRGNAAGSPWRSCRPGARKTPKITEVLPLLYLHGLSTGDFVPSTQAVPRQLGRAVRTGDHQVDRDLEGRAGQVFSRRDLSGVDYVYLWADGIHVNIRLEEHKLCLLVLIGVRADGRKELVALADGYRESTESWADLLRDRRPPRDAHPGARDWGRRARVLGCAERGVPR